MKAPADTPENAAVSTMSAETGKQVIHTKATLNANEDTEIDFSEMEKRLLDNLKGESKKMLEGYFKELHEAKPADKNGKGVVEAYTEEDQKKKTRVLEEFKKGAALDTNIIKEQWTVAVPRFSRYELAAHLRDFVWVTDAVKGKAGETVNIPVVYDVNFAHVTPKTGTFTATTELINVYTTTLHEAGAYYDAYYGDIEKIDSNMLDELNRVFAHAAVRAEDKDLIDLLNTATTGQFNSKGGSTQTPAMYVGTTCDTLDIPLIVDAMTGLMARGKDVSPGELVLILSPVLYGVLLKKIVASTPLTQAKPEVAQKGIVEDFLGIKIIVTNAKMVSHAYSGCAGSSYNIPYLLRPKRALALAPKRDILIETDKLIENRQLRIAASHTFGVLGLDYTEVMAIKCCDDPTSA